MPALESARPHGIIRLSPVAGGTFQNVDNGPNEEADALYLIAAVRQTRHRYLHMSGTTDWAAANRTATFREKCARVSTVLSSARWRLYARKSGRFDRKGLIDAV